MKVQVETRNYAERCFTLVIVSSVSFENDFHRVSYVPRVMFKAAWYITGQSEAKCILVMSVGDFMPCLGWKIDKHVSILNFVDFIRYLLFVMNTDHHLAQIFKSLGNCYSHSGIPNRSCWKLKYSSLLTQLCDLRSSCASFSNQ